jgi:hypothetical protein
MNSYLIPIVIAYPRSFLPPPTTRPRAPHVLPRWQHTPLLATAEIPQDAATVKATRDATGANPGEGENIEDTLW